MASPAFAAANMTVSIDDSVNVIGVGEQVTYTFHVRNAGDHGDANVVLSATITDGTFLGATIDQPGANRFDECHIVTPPIGRFAGNGSLRCTGGFFDQGDQATVT